MHYKKFLARIGRSDSPACHFCNTVDETLVHLFCECEKITPLWDSLVTLIQSKTGDSFDFSEYQKMFGLELEDTEHYITINFLILCLKFYIHMCKFQNSSPSFQAYKKFIKIKINTEYKIADSKGKLSKHLKKFSFDLGF